MGDDAMVVDGGLQKEVDPLLEKAQGLVAVELARMSIHEQVPSFTEDIKCIIVVDA